MNIRVWCCLAAQGIVNLLVDCFGSLAGVVSTTCAGLSCGVWKAGAGWWCGVCLLADCWVLRQHVGVVSGVVFENCRVDASIFVASCVGRMVDVLASGADEGRGRLR